MKEEKAKKQGGGSMADLE